jgi:serine/threonine protein kinase
MMKKKLIFIPLLAILILTGFLFYRNIAQNSVIILKNEQIIITEEAWTIGDSVFYRTPEDVRSIPTTEVFDIKHKGVLNKGSSIFFLAKHQLATGKQKLSDFLADVPFEKIDFKKWSLLAGAAVLVIALLIVVVLFVKRGLKSIRRKPKQTGPAADKIAEEIAYSGQEQIVQFFLNIFKFQKEMPADGEASFRPVGLPSPDGNTIYELRVKIGDEWTTRRMTIGPIGEESGSRSTCYYAIFDDHIVIKVPPQPVLNFEKYIGSIKRDAKIAEQLAPKECLIPRVSVILKKVHPFYEDSDLPPEKLEAKYIDWLKENAEFQAYLKIGEGFAYFMDLSKYFFLGNILHMIHGIDDKMVEEICERPDIMWNPVEFEARYGSQNAHVCDKINPLYASFQNRVHDLIQQNNLGDTISDFNIKEWFLLYLSGKKLSTVDMDLKTGIVSGISTIASKVFREKPDQVEYYRGMIRSYVTTKNLKQHNTQIANLVINLLDLLAWIHQKKVSMRDLKPDNLLVAGNPSKFPQFLESASLFSIGLIDVETAVSYDSDDPKAIKQPPLGGTPSLATPTHQLKNETIQLVYKDIPLILHLQDWYATVGIIYQIITGERLFVKTAKTLLQLKKMIKDGTAKKGNPLETLREVSLTFWKLATAEFEMKTKANEKKLQYISLIASKESKILLLKFIAGAQKRILKAVQNIIDTQTWFKGDKAKKNLYSAPPLKIAHFKIKFMEQQEKSLPPEERQKVVKMLADLEHLKKQAAHLLMSTKGLQKSVPIISSHDLLKTMFLIVLIEMHQAQWGPVSSN